MDQERESLKPMEGADRSLRRRLDLKGEFVLALLPTIVVLVMLGMVEAFSRQRLLFASLASSAFLIYLDPQHGTNSVRTLVISQMTAALVGFLTFSAFGPGYAAAGGAMVVTIVVMILLDAVHPPAVSTSLSFAFRAGNDDNLMLFGMAVMIVALLVVMERVSLWLLARFSR
jgi:CBS-domain-containing membrane protein